VIIISADPAGKCMSLTVEEFAESYQIAVAKVDK